MKRSKMTFLFILILMLVAAGCGQKAAEKPAGSSSPAAAASSPTKDDKKDGGAYKIGAILSLTGPSGWLGQSTQRAVETLKKQINASGGVNGHPLEIIFYDDQSKPEEASRWAKRLVNEDKVQVIIGPNGTPTSKAAEQVAASSGIPMVSMSGGYIPDPKVGWGWSVVHSTDQVIERQFQYFANKGMKNIGVINPNDALGQIADAAIKKYADQYKITITKHESFNVADINVKPQLTSIMSTKPEAVISFVTGEPAVKVRKEMTDIGMKVPMLPPHSSATQAFLELIGKVDNGLVFAAGGIITAADQIPANHPQKQVIDQFITNFKAEHNYVPGYIEGFGYDALNAVYHAIKKVGYDPKKIKEYMENSEEIIGVNGTFKFTKDNRIGLSPETLRIVEIRDNKWTLVE
jgi:branched-chain amino acid transport system substrate-binding protein